MLDKFVSLFRRQVTHAVTEGADQGLRDAELTARVKAAFEDGVREALGGLHELLAQPEQPRAKKPAAKKARKQPRRAQRTPKVKAAAKAESNGKLVRNRLAETVTASN